MKMCVDKSRDKCRMINRKKLGHALKTALAKARLEQRLICGLFPAISYLEKCPDDVVLCVLPTVTPGDSTTHIQAVLLQAYCYENYIPVIKVDSTEKLSIYCGVFDSKTSDELIQYNCAIITRDRELPITDKIGNVSMTANEQFLAKFYECTLEEFPQPVIQLPI